MANASIPSYPLDILLVNQSTVVSDDLLKSYIDAFQTQITRDFAPAWGTPGFVSFHEGRENLPANKIWMVVLDDSDQAGALGYHDLTNTGLPMGKIFAKTDLTFGSSLSVTISHEILELLADPGTNRVVQVGSRFYWVEVGDPCESDQIGYKIGDILVTDFALPEYFSEALASDEIYFAPGPDGTVVNKPNTPSLPVETPLKFYDFLQKWLPAPVPYLAGGGYVSYLDTTTGQVSQIVNRNKPSERVLARPSLGSRRYRRSLKPREWLRSESK